MKTIKFILVIVIAMVSININAQRVHKSIHKSKVTNAYIREENELKNEIERIRTNNSETIASLIRNMQTDIENLREYFSTDEEKECQRRKDKYFEEKYHPTERDSIKNLVINEFVKVQENHNKYENNSTDLKLLEECTFIWIESYINAYNYLPLYECHSVLTKIRNYNISYGKH